MISSFTEIGLFRHGFMSHFLLKAKYPVTAVVERVVHWINYSFVLFLILAYTKTTLRNKLPVETKCLASKFYYVT